MGEQHVLTVAGRFENIRSVCKFVARGAEQSGLDDTAVFHVELACDEACTNIIEHAYGAEDIGEIRVSWQVEDDRFVITLHDNGRSFDLGELPGEDDVPFPSDSVDDIQEGGLGLHFMRKLMDEISFDFDKITGNTLIMVKRFGKERAS